MGILGVFLFLLETRWTTSLHFEHSFAVWIKFWKWDPKLKMSRSSLMHLLEYQRPLKSPGQLVPQIFFFLVFCFFWLRYFAKSSNNFKWEAIFLPLTKPIWSSFTIVFITFRSLSASALVKICNQGLLMWLVYNYWGHFSPSSSLCGSRL